MHDVHDTLSPGSPEHLRHSLPGEPGRCTPASSLLVARSAHAGTRAGAAPSTAAGLEVAALAAVSVQRGSSLAACSAFQPSHRVSLTILIFHEYQLPFVLFLYYFDQGLCQIII